MNEASSGTNINSNKYSEPVFIPPFTQNWDFPTKLVGWEFPYIPDLPYTLCTNCSHKLLYTLNKAFEGQFMFYEVTNIPQIIALFDISYTFSTPISKTLLLFL